MKKHLLFLISLVLILSAGYASAAFAFTDVSANHWAKEEVTYLTSRNITSGIGEEFGVNDAMTREQTAVMLAKSLNVNLQNVSTIPIRDVPSTHPSYPAIAAMMEAGIFQTSATFQPQKLLSRSQMAKVLTIAFKLKGSHASLFKDVPSTHWAHHPIAALTAHSITLGYRDNTFCPEKLVTRSQFAVMLARVMHPPFREKVKAEWKARKEQEKEKVSYIPPIEKPTIVRSVPKGYVAITIDDGPTTHTTKLLDVLKAYNVPVTFFVLGENVVRYPQAIRRTEEEGHVIGHHSYTHPDFKKLSITGQRQELDRGLTVLSRVVKQKVNLFRPPYGSYNTTTLSASYERGMHVVMWDTDPRDWDTKSATTIKNRVLHQVVSGSVIVMHDRLATIEALPAIIEGIRKKGYKLVALK
ncbi:polysaccharide deacetylase family protein [Metabacillus iocasae]|nr:polysaccharide deacetylase family protein [Metabacillus iocasae]